MIMTLGPATWRKPNFCTTWLTWKAAGKASAQAVCVIACWATRAGATGPAQSLAVAPGKDSGKYSQKSDSGVHADHRDELMYSLTTPSTNRANGIPCEKDVMVQPPHDLVTDEVDNTPDMTGGARASVATLPSHPPDSHGGTA